MKIAFDAKRLFHNRTGLGNYSRSLVENIRQVSEGHDLYLFAPRTDDSLYTSFFSGQYLICEGKGKFLWRLKNIVKDIDRLGIDIYHGLSNELPVGISKLTSTKSIVTIHDLIFLRYPEFYPAVDRILYSEKSKRACKVADHIIAVSEATKRDIVHFFGTNPEKITVIYQAYDEIFAGDIDKTEEEAPDRPFILYVGSISERKNLKNLLQALTQISKETRPQLKVVGKGGSYEKKMKELTLSLDLNDDVRFLGHVENKTLRQLYKQSISLVYPSLYEGFGIPIVEALVCGTNVICSNVSSLPEAGSGLATLVDPHSIDEIQAAIEQVLKKPSADKKLQIELVNKRFNPIRHAQEVMSLYDRVCKC